MVARKDGLGSKSIICMHYLFITCCEYSLFFFIKRVKKKWAVKGRLAGKGEKVERPNLEELIFDLSAWSQEKKKDHSLFFYLTLLYLSVLKGHSKSGRETVKALSVSLSCNNVTSWALRWDERSLFMSSPGAWSRLFHSQVLPLLTASPPPPVVSLSLSLEDRGHFTLTKTEVWELR